MLAEFDERDYATARGHLVKTGDHVVVMTPNSVLTYGIVEQLRPRHVGDVGDVLVRDPGTRRVLITNAFCVEPDTSVTKFRPYPFKET